MAQQPDGIQQDLNDPVIMIGSQLFYYNPIDGSYIPLGDPIVDGPHYQDPPAGAFTGQYTTSYSSQVPSNTDPSSTSDPYSTEEWTAQHQLINDGKQLVDDSSSQADLLKGIGQGHSNLTIAPDLSDDFPADVPSAHVENAEHTVTPDSQRTPAQRSAGIPSQHVDPILDIDHVEAHVMRLLAQNTSVERGLHIKQRLCYMVDEHLNTLTNEPPPGPPVVHKPGNKGDKPKLDRTRLYYRCWSCGMETQNINVLRRHVDSMHYPQWEFHCHHEDEDCTTYSSPKKPPRRRDKIQGHYRFFHHYHDAPEDIIDERKVPLPCESICVVCRRTVQDWREFYDCFVEHCKIKPASSNAGPSQRDGHDPANKKRKHDYDRDQFDGGAGTGGPALSQQGYWRSGNATGLGQHHFPPGLSGNQMSNGDSRPLLQQRSASDGCDGRKKGPQAKAARPPTSNPQPSGSGSGSNQKRPSKGKNSQPRLDPRNLQGQESSQPPADKCKYCSHVFSTCPEFCNSPPSTELCHACPRMQRPQVMEARNTHANQVVGQSPVAAQAMGFRHHAQFDPQGFPDARLNIPMMPQVNPAGYAAMQQRYQQPSQLLREQAQAQGMGPRTNTQQNLFGGSSFYMAGVVHDVQVRGMSEVDIETSILDSKRKLGPKKTQGSNIWSVVLPFRGSPPPLRKPLLGMASIPASAMEIITRQFIGPVPLSKVNPSSKCRCPCSTRSQGTYFARGRVDIAGGRRIEMAFKMAPEARGTGHPLRTRIQVVVKMLRLRSSASRSASAKHKQEAHDAIKEALEATLDGSETTTITYEDEAGLDNPGYDSDVESVTESIFSSCSRVSSFADLTQFSPPSSPPALTFSRTSTCTDLMLPSPCASPEVSACPQKSSCTDLKLGAPARSSSPFRRNWNDDTPSTEEQPVHDVEIFEEEEKELELTFDLDLKSSLDMLSRWTGVPTDDLRSSLSVWDPDRVFKYLMNHWLFVIFSLARSRENDLNPCWDKKRSSQS